MTLLTVNAGSSSLRLALYQWHRGDIRLLASERYATHESTESSLIHEFVTKTADTIAIVVHRVVHGGNRFRSAVLIDEEVEAAILQLSTLAPLHNPVALRWVQACRALFGADTPQVAVFDTAFSSTLPAVASTYALPRDLCQRHDLRRYGFHGIAHQAMWQRWCELRPELEGKGRVISIQLGSGCSISAVEDGQVRDTSMGFSPLEGLVMSTRCGDLDPGIITFLQREEGLDARQAEALLNEQCGLLGLSGESQDMRRLLESDSSDARLAVAVYCYRVRKYIGAYLTVLGGCDGILFGGGVGENAPLVRASILDGLTWLGIHLDVSMNAQAVGREKLISHASSAMEIRVIPVDESVVMAQEAVAFYNASRSGGHEWKQ